MKYDAICLDCTHQYDYYRSIAERMDVPPCPSCGGHDVRKVIVNAPDGCVTGKFQAFKSQIDGTIIRSNRDLEEHNRRNNVRLLGEGYSNQDIMEGKCGQQGPKEPDKKEIAKDIVEAIRRCESGYKPQIQSEGAEL